MQTLWAMAVMLPVHVAALVEVIPPSNLRNLPVRTYSMPDVKNPIPPLCRELPSGLPIPRDRPSREPWKAGTARVRCPTVAKYFVSKHRLENYLNETLPQKIEKLLMCEQVDLAGLLGSVLSTLKNLDVGSLTSSLSVLDGLGVGGLLGKGGSSSNSLEVPLVSDLLSGSQQPQGSQPATGTQNNALNGLTGTAGLQNLPLPTNVLNGLTGSLGLPKVPSSVNDVNGLTGSLGLPRVLSPVNDVLDKAGEVSESTDSLLNQAVVPETKDAVGDLLNSANVDELLLGLEVTKVTVDNVNFNITGDGIYVQATAVISIGGEGLLGPVVNIVGFSVDTETSLTIGISTNNTQCPTLQVQDKDIAAKKVNVMIVKMVTESLPLPLPAPIPLDDTVAKLLTIEMRSQSKDSKSCDTAFSDVKECRNSTGLFKYRIKMNTFSEDGLSILYCADAILNGQSTPVFGDRLPPSPKNANLSMTLSRGLVRVIVANTAMQSSVSRDGLQTTVTKVRYSYVTPNQIQGTYSVDIQRDGTQIATGETIFILSRDSKISNNRLLTDIQLLSSEHSVTPPEAIEEVKEIMIETLKKLYSNLKENIKEINVPPGLSPLNLNNAEVFNVNLDLQAAN